MGGRGFPPQPDALKLLKGLPGRRPPRGQAPTIAPGELPEPTDLLDADGLAEWRRLVPILQVAGLATPADAAGLTVLCALWGVWTQLQRALATEGLVVLRRGVSHPHPLLRPLAALAPLLRVYFSEFGATPGGRARIRVDPPQPKTKVDEFREKHGG